MLFENAWMVNAVAATMSAATMRGGSTMCSSALWSVVAAGRIHYFVDATMMGPHGDHSGSDDAARIADWVTLNFSSRTVGSTTVYDLSE